MPAKKSFDSLVETLGDQFKGSGPLGLGCSGGLDSMVLAEAMAASGISFRLLHFNHGWRKSADRDRDFVKEWARAHSVPFTTRKWARPKKQEAAARHARFDFFRSCCQRFELQGVLLAHQQDDLAETLLLNLIRGTGPSGLASLKAESEIAGLRLFRPLLPWSRKNLESMARSQKLTWREDPSNRRRDFARNRVRHELLPLIEIISGRDTSPLLARTSRILMEENDYWEQTFSKLPQTLSVRELRSLHPAAQRRKILAWLQAQTEAAPDFNEVESVRRLVHEPQPAKVNLKRGIYCRRRSGLLFIEK